MYPLIRPNSYVKQYTQSYGLTSMFTPQKIHVSLNQTELVRQITDVKKLTGHSAKFDMEIDDVNSLK